MIRAVTFDLDDTLFDFQGCMARAAEQVIRALCERHPSATGRATLERFHALWQHATDEARAMGGIPDWPAIRRRGIELLLQESGCEAGETPAAELTALYFQHRRAPVAPFEDAAAMLSRLAERVPLGIITNANTQLAQLGLAERFSVRGCSHGPAHRGASIFCRDQGDPRALRENDGTRETRRTSIS